MTLPLNRFMAAMLLALVACTAIPTVATAAVSEKPGSKSSAPVSEGEKGSLVYAAKTAEGTGRKIATSLIAVGFAIASIVLSFRRDFKEAAGVFAIGLVAVLLASQTGIDVLRKTVDMLFGA